MKTMRLPLTAFALLCGPTLATAGLVINQPIEYQPKGFVPTAIPDFSSSGLVSVISVSTGGKFVQSLEVSLVTSGGWNGDLYAYLQHSSGSDSYLSILLNRPGRTDDNDSGSGTSGLDLVFSDSAPTDLSTAISSFSTGSPVTGTFQPDGRAKDPDFVTTSSPRTLFLSGFTGMLADGDWTLFIADLGAGDTATLESWSLAIVTSDSPIAAIPEPSDFLLGAVPALFGGIVWLRRRAVRRKADAATA